MVRHHYLQLKCGFQSDSSQYVSLPIEREVYFLLVHDIFCSDYVSFLTKALSEEIINRKRNVDQAVKNGQALLKQTTGIVFSGGYN